MVKEWIRGKLGILENEKAIANNAAIDAAQATDIANNTAINVAQSEEIAKLGEAVADQQKIMIACIAVSAVAAVALTCFVAFCIWKGNKLNKEKEKNLSKDTSDAKLNNADYAGIPEKLDNSTAEGLQKFSNDIAA
ncbi:MULTISPECIES: hypothetical protein [Wolbachia]|uniref:Uncharacterized protein n=1 Tax=Wolbachia pipientis TaxID=955 RepID=A0A7G5CDY0_WOLPI|nr:MULTISPECIES: hypothetical protein [Wolbachia]MDE5061205.1 hypothetical protein [Wolbachia endosymbiont of Drosophila nikananu]QMV47414.1 hypothetical protein HC356_05485 [Wolbachia pipientis]